MSARLPIRTHDHGIDPDDLDEDAAKVLRRLNQHGFEAYLVGGGVRDLLLGRTPKDFDIVTDARPSEVRRLFRNCRLIGRRFRLAHLLAGGKVIECATFRATPESNGDDLLITDDNEFGTAETDSRRRDFTINGLFYDRQRDEVIDFVGGLDDLERGLVRAIGEPTIRFREDPVRMLRAVKFAARLEFDIDAPDREAIQAERADLAKAAVPRLFEEIVRMLWGGAARRSMELLESLGLLELLIPEIAAYLSRPTRGPWRRLGPLLDGVDERCGGRAEVPNGVLLAALFWPMFQTLVGRRNHDGPKLRAITEELVAPFAVRYRVPRRDLAALVGALDGQFRFAQVRRGRHARASFARGPHFGAALELLTLRSLAGEVGEEELSAWQELAREHPASDVEDDDEPRRRRRRGRRRRRRD